jgi:hypothetical protein
MKTITLFLFFISLGAVAGAATVPTVQFTQTRVLRNFEEKWLSIGKILGDGKFAANIVSNNVLTNETAFKGVTTELDRQLQLRRAADKQLGVGVKFFHRQFDMDFLHSPLSRFALVAIVNRMDRMYVDPSSCGEVRLIYRLAYNYLSQGENVSSRLPMTINLIFKARPDDSNESCAEIANRWNIPSETSLALSLSVDDKTSAFSEALIKITDESSPIQAKVFTLKNLVQLEINLQATRWPSAVRPEFGGYGEYILQVFKLDQTQNLFLPSTMENELDIQKVNSNPDLKKKLKEWITNAQNLKSLDDGTAILPKDFLATSGMSITPGGSLRLQNRPIMKLFKSSDFEELDFSALKRIKNASTLLRRIDEHSCIGCHQVRNVAGFHLMGKDPSLRYPGNSVFVPGSPHFFADQPRRITFLKLLSNAKSPSFERGFVERPDDPEALNLLNGTGLVNGWGSPCSLGKNSSFNSWTCAPGLICSTQDSSDIDNELGICRSKNNAEIGEACEKGKITNYMNPHLDSRVLTMTAAPRSDGFSCSSQKGGFPGGGMLGLKDCSKLPVNSVCGVLPTAKPGFNACVLGSKNFTECLREFATPRAMRACDEKNPCRDDYICSQTNDAKKGSCVPPYFLFQFRVDGHPIGKSGI